MKPCLSRHKAARQTTPPYGAPPGYGVAPQMGYDNYGYQAAYSGYGQNYGGYSGYGGPPAPWPQDYQSAEAASWGGQYPGSQDYQYYNWNGYQGAPTTAPYSGAAAGRTPTAGGAATPGSARDYYDASAVTRGMATSPYVAPAPTNPSMRGRVASAPPSTSVAAPAQVNPYGAVRRVGAPYNPAAAVRRPGPY